MIKYLIACAAVFAHVFATELNVRLLPEDSLADLIPSKPNLLITGLANMNGRMLFSLISNHITSLLPNKNLTFECLDFKFMSNTDLFDICHNHLFVNKGTFDVVASGSRISNGSIHVNLFLPEYIPVDEHVLFPAFKETYEKIKLSALTSYHSMLSSLMKKTFVMPEDHPVLTLSGNMDLAEIEEKTWQLDFAAFSMLHDLKGRLKEFMLIDPEAYNQTFKTRIQLTRGIQPRAYLYFRSESEKHICAHLKEHASLKDKELTQKQTRLAQLQGNLDSAITEQRVLAGRIQALQRSSCELQLNLKRAEDAKEELKQDYDNLKADSETAAEQLVKTLYEKSELDKKIEELEEKSLESVVGMELLKQKLSDSEIAIEDGEKCIASQKGLIKSLHTSCELGVSFTNLIDRPSIPEDLQNMIKWTHAAARFESLGDLSEYDESNLGPEEKKALRKLWLETYYAEGLRLRNWLELAKSNDWRDSFGFEACYTTITDDFTEEKIKRKLAKMRNDIIRLESRVMEVIDALQEKCKDVADNEDVNAFKNATEQNANSALDVEIYIKAFTALLH